MNENINIERGLLSAIVFEDGTKEELLNKLEKMDFALPFHQHLFGVMASLLGQGKPVTEEFILPYVDDLAFGDVLSANIISTPFKYIDELKVLRKHREWSLALAKASKMGTDEAMEYLTEVKDHTLEYEKPLFTLSPLSQAEDKDIEFLGLDFIPVPKKAVTMITAKGGTGKSFVTLQIMLRYLRVNPTKKVFGWFSEDPIGVTKHRALGICRMLGYDTDILNRLMIVGSDQDVKHLYSTDGLTKDFELLKGTLQDYEMVVIDPLIGFFGEEENSNTHARAFMNGLMSWSNNEDKAIVIIHHTNKQGESRGASAFLDASRLTYSVSRFGKDEESAKDDHLFLGVDKDNYNAKYKLNGKDQVKVFPFKLENDFASNEDTSPSKGALE